MAGTTTLLSQDYSAIRQGINEALLTHIVGKFLEHSGTFWFNKVTTCWVITNCNKKTGIDAEEFCKYIEDCIVNTCDQLGKQELLLGLSSPGRVQKEMMVRLKLSGMYINSQEKILHTRRPKLSFLRATRRTM